MTSTSNAVREVGRLSKARAEAQTKFKQQSMVLANMEHTEAEQLRVTAKWHAQLAALANLSGGATVAADLSGVPKAEIDAAVKTADPEAVKRELAAATPRQRRRRPAEDGTPATPVATTTDG